MMRRRLRVAVLLLVVLVGGSPLCQAQVKNVILMIADGAGFNSWNATSMYQGRWDTAAGRSQQIFDGLGWIHLACATYALNTAGEPTGNTTQDEALVYDPLKAWDREQGYEWLSAGSTDSAAAATALSSGQRSYRHAINWSNTDEPLNQTIVKAAKAAGKAAGIVTSVHWSDATPSALGDAHARDRNDFEKIAQEMLNAGQLEVIMGAGNPDFDENGRPKEGQKEYKFVGGEAVWKAIEEARTTPGGTYQGFRPVSTRAEFEALLSGPVPRKVLGTAQVAKTLQQGRTEPASDVPPYSDPRIANVPSLADMAHGALRVLGDNPCGLFLMVEGGAVDWANHQRDAGRMIEEQSDFFRAVRTVIDWVETNSNWNETVLILTADHDTGKIWGPDSENTPFQPLANQGVGKVPGLHYNARQHNNALVPVYAFGDGAVLLVEHVIGSDPVRGPYIANVDIAMTIQTLLGESAETTVPATETPAPVTAAVAPGAAPVAATMPTPVLQ